ncbi:hypothetical protein J437_LFUL004258 [Ladona fulva]|uniref:Uncharacterized protein n=1 Tax=Ladona fulva TaxID=123851 RepID=A0A8K0KEL0_LADFU|nr:hypothetical protein J437_LFUL004258 [Ladona fulva]
MEKVILFAVLLFGAAYSLDFEHCAEEINRIDMEVHVNHGDAEITFAGEGVHKCSGFQEGECKYAAGTKVNYFFLFPVFIESNEEEVLQFKITLKNENGTPLTCAKFNAKIRDGAAAEVPVAEGSA